MMPEGCGTPTVGSCCPSGCGLMTKTCKEHGRNWAELKQLFLCSGFGGGMALSSRTACSQGMEWEQMNSLA